ncbi:nucleotidyltransferase family protein [Cellulomonas sp. URHB0016]
MRFTLVMGLVGIVLAAGAGARAGGPKVLRASDGVPWVARAVDRLRDGGCEPVLVVLGAGADEARPLLPPGSVAVQATDWSQGMSASFRAGLVAAGRTDATAAVVSLVDLPTLPRSVVQRLLGDPVTATTLRRVVIGGVPGHPVVVGRDHWAAASTTMSGDLGAGAYLRAHRAATVECSDLWDGQDVDGP